MTKKKPSKRRSTPAPVDESLEIVAPGDPDESLEMTAPEPDEAPSDESLAALVEVAPSEDELPALQGPPVRVLVATGNPHKLREFQQILDGTRFEPFSLLDLDDVPEIIEDGATFRENAFKKAHTLAVARDCITVADDSGLEVDALDGAPGVHSARFAGAEGEGADAANNALLIKKLADVPFSRRTARFRCSLAVVTPSGEVRYSDGAVEGRITLAPRGDHGFGYDPYFAVAGDPEGRTSAELEPAEKNRVSHRGVALRGLLPALSELLS